MKISNRGKRTAIYTAVKRWQCPARLVINPVHRQPGVLAVFQTRN